MNKLYIFGIMKKYISLFIVAAFVVTANAQQFPNPDLTYGKEFRRVMPDSTLYLPTGCGAPSGTASLKSTVINKAAKYYDSCAGLEYTFNPKLQSWSVSGSGGHAGNADSLGHIAAASYLKYSDTSSLLGNYARYGWVVKYTDTSSMLSNRLKISDTTYAFSNRLKISDTAYALSNRLKISDTANAFSNYLRKTTLILPSEGGTGYTSLSSLASDAAFTGKYLPLAGGTSYQMTGPIVWNTLAAPQLTLGSAGANFGNIGNISNGVWQLGYSSSATTLGTGVLIWNSSGSVTLGSTSGTGTGALYAGTGTFGGNLSASNSLFTFSSGANINNNSVTSGYSFGIYNGSNASSLYVQGAAAFASSVTGGGFTGNTTRFSSNGSDAGYSFFDRVNTSHFWLWYASGDIANLYNSGLGNNAVTFNYANNNAIFSSSVSGQAASFTTGSFSGNVGINVSPFGVSTYKTLSIDGSSGGTGGLLNLRYNGTDQAYFYVNNAAFNIESVSTLPFSIRTNGVTALTINSSQQATFPYSVTASSFSASANITGGTGLSGALTGTLNNISIGSTQYTPLVGSNDDRYMKVTLYDGGSNGTRGGFSYGYDAQGNFGGLTLLAQRSFTFQSGSGGSVFVINGTYNTVYTALPIWSSISTSAIPFANINDAYNSGATPYGQIFNSAIHEYALGYGSTPNVNGTAVLKWNTSGNVTVAGTFGMKGYTVGTLPAGVTGAWAYVTDASGPTYGATVVGGGSVVTPVFYNGSNWTCR